MPDINFSLAAAGTSVPAGTSSAATAIPTLGGTAPIDLMIYNPDASNTVFCRIGNSAITANANCMPILPGEKSVWNVRGATHIATFRTAGTTAISVFPGEGS